VRWQPGLAMESYQPVGVEPARPFGHFLKSPSKASYLYFNTPRLDQTRAEFDSTVQWLADLQTRWLTTSDSTHGGRIPAQVIEEERKRLPLVCAANAQPDKDKRQGGEFYTPRDVVRLMVEILQPQEGKRIYDPAVGSGGMLIISKQYIEEHGGDASNLSLYGQDENVGVWAICKMNMILHGIINADIQSGDVIGNPRHEYGGELMRFDYVISNPPFSKGYSKRTRSITGASSTASRRGEGLT